MNTLGKLERVQLRDIWESEASDFTPWLAKEENLAILSEAIGIELELEAQEKNVGPFRADLLCKDPDTDNWVLIENQLARTDHTHLGQLMTYASGLQTVTIVWIAAKFSDEHRAALDWLNEITDSEFRFFGLEVELWKIGDSPAAPRFNIISKPNDWSRSVDQAAKKIDTDAVSDTKAQQLKYWQALHRYLDANQVDVQTRTPKPRHWNNYPIGRSKFRLTTTVNTVGNRIGVELYMSGDDAKTSYALLHEQKEDIEAAVGEPLSWQELPDRIATRIAIYLENVDPTDENDWPRQHQWMADHLATFDRVLRPRVRALDLDEYREG